ncbi:MAG: asparagine synthase (glutamine-hydrolyzing) [Gracilimonas sp.]|uniref:asparagine synthase (glutamine-hydrolyzing) n=1 Tax=Gracilimonas sp. TaxID=1974203 RepID=UPI001B255B26|nr:asparagine synthase (glutamine-hydrolyzing) [Gracilimonas sp.]MBO6587221.1 asparagine synthase (glutamine-hydrolyzing) [Gracilimonas sp.]MBO6614291.1 asparagine synthase (glutamine-hydrolyzing) [Gracilimonas sp.]
MCGIVGFNFLNQDKCSNPELIRNLLSSVAHRGPDDSGFEVYRSAMVGNTRLSIIDLSSGHQPMIGDDGNVSVVQNGEIFNYIELKEVLIKKGHDFKTESDTEVILKAYIEWGEAFVNRLNGMFAIAILDKKRNQLLLFRDRLGVKPLYYYQKEGDFLFSSEIKSFKKYNYFDKKVNNQSIANYLVLNYIPVPDTIFEYVHHIPPGYFGRIQLGDNSLELVQYWDIAHLDQNNNLSENDFIDSFEELLIDAVKLRLRSDVDVGAFLSGGLDSSLICALMRKNDQESEISTFSIGFHEKKFDESQYAKYVAQKYSLNNKLKFLGGDIVHLWDKVTYHNDQPHGDISFIPTYILSEFASKDLKVVLTGDGGDELFAGYLKYQMLENTGDLQKYFDTTTVFNEKELMNSLSPAFKKTINVGGARKLFTNCLAKVESRDLLNKVLYFETKQLLPGNNLVKPDKMAMANSLETRSPFMDYRLFELCYTMPGELKLRNGETKYLLKKLGLRYFNEEHVYRRKQMFTVPIGEWFKNKLGDYLMTIIESERLIERNIWDATQIRQLADDHKNGRENNTRKLRAIVNLELWYRMFID